LDLAKRKAVPAARSQGNANPLHLKIARDVVVLYIIHFKKKRRAKRHPNFLPPTLRAKAFAEHFVKSTFPLAQIFLTQTRAHAQNVVDDEEKRKKC